jgi:hypothetical protein
MTHEVEKVSDTAAPNIIITGSFRSGTTLLFLLFPHAFKEVITNRGESGALETRLPVTFKWRVCKRPNDIHRVRIIYELLDPYIIYMIRDPRDCIVSWKEIKGDYHLSYNEWQRNLLFAESSKSRKLIFVRFENMILRPAETQALLLERIEGLEEQCDLARCYQRVDGNSPIVRQLSHDSGPRRSGETIRPLDPSVIGAWRHHKGRVRDQLRQFPELQAALEKYEYEKDASWQQLLDEADC